MYPVHLITSRDVTDCDSYFLLVTGLGLVTWITSRPSPLSLEIQSPSLPGFEYKHPGTAMCQVRAEDKDFHFENQTSNFANNMALLVNNEANILSPNVDRKISNTSIGSSEVYMIDPSEHFRPEHKSAEEYRIYTTDQVIEATKTRA